MAGLRCVAVALGAALCLPACNHSGASVPSNAGSASGSVGSPGSGSGSSPFAQALWVANGTDVLEFLPAQLVAGVSDPSPYLKLESPAFGSPQGLAFDGSGNLWVVDSGTVDFGGSVRPALYEFTASALAGLSKSSMQLPAKTVHFAGLSFPQQAAFDKSGTLWVSDAGSDRVFAFDAAQLAGGGNVTPRVQLASNPSFAGALGLVLTASGDLWVANSSGTTIYGFAAGALPGSGSVTLAPNVVLSDDGHDSVAAPWALAFDAAGDLWSSNSSPPYTLVAFAPAALRAPSAPTPAITISSNADGAFQTLDEPNGIAFDSGGNLAVANASTDSLNGGTLAVFGASQLKATGDPRPSVLIGGSGTTLTLPAGLTFGPIVK
jgi:sugar lactone lactonase YvrE